MNNPKIMSLKAKLEVDLQSIKRIEGELKKLAGSFGQFKEDVKNATQGMDKTIQQAFFGKRGTDRSTIKTFFKKEFQGIIKAFTDEIKLASATISASAKGVSDQTIAHIAQIVVSQQKKIDELTKNSVKKVSKSVKHPVYGKLTKEQYGVVRDNLAAKERLKEETALNKSEKFKLSDEDKAFRRYVLIWTKRQEDYAKMVEKDRILRAKAAANNLYGDIRAEQKAGTILARQNAQQERLTSSNQYSDIIAEQKAATAERNRLARERRATGSNLYADVRAEQRTETNQRQQAARTLRERIRLEVAAANTMRGIDEREFQRRRRLDRIETRARGEELLLELRVEQDMHNARIRLRQQEVDNARNNLRSILGMDQNNFLSNINAAPLTSFVQGFKQGFEGITGMVSSAGEKLKTFFKIMATGAVASLGAFAATGAIIKKLASGVLFATEKMRGYEIALFGMMKTQDGVNQLMEKAFKVTKNLPISYEQVYQSTKAFTLIGPVRDMLKNVGETETVLKRMYSITMALSQIEPEWGLAGAQFSLREALSGDLRSLQRRFEIPVNLIYSKDGRSLRDLKNDPEAMSQALSDYFQEFYNEETLGMAANQFGAVLGKIEGIWFNFQNTIGNAGFYDLFVDKLRNVRDELDKFSESMEFKDVTNRISNSLGSSLESMLSIVEKLVTGFGKLIGINVESSNAFQMGADVVEKFAAALRIIDRIITEVDIFGMLNKALEKTKSIMGDITNFGSKVFKSVANDVEKIVNVVKELPIGKLNMTEIGGKGLFYLWLFGAGNIFSTIAGFSTMILSTVFTISKVIEGAFAVNTLLSNALGVNILKWVGLIGGMVLGFESIGGAAKFAFDSIDAGLESSTFYKIYMWMTGQTSTDELQRQFDMVGKRFNVASEIFTENRPGGGLSNVSFASQLAKISGVDEAKINQGLSKDTSQFLSAFMKREDGLNQILAAITALEDVTKTLNPATKEAQYIHGATSVMRTNVTKLSGMDLSKISSRYNTQGDLNAKFEGNYYGRFNDVIQKTINGLTDASKLVGSGVDAIETMITPLKSAAEKQLLAARTDPEMIKRGDSAVTGLTTEAKVGTAALLDFFKASGYSVGLTSGVRPEDTDSTHSLGTTTDMQLMNNGKFLTASDVQSPKFQSMVKALQANQMIEKLFLEAPDTSIYGGIYDKSLLQKSDAKGPHIHVQWKKGISEKANGLQEMLGGLTDSYDLLAKLQNITTDELSKSSPQLVKNDFLKQNFQRATEFITNVYHPMMNATKEGYDSVKEIFAEESNLSESLFKGMEDDGVAKAGPRVINKLNKSFDNYKAMFKEGLKKAGGENWMALDVMGREVRQLYLDMGSYINESGILTSRAVQENAPKPNKGILSRYSDTLDQIALIFDFDNMWEGFKSKELNKQEMINTALWKDTVKKKTFEYVSMFDGNIQEIQNQIMQGIASEAFTKVAYDSGMNTSQREMFDKTTQRVMTRMKIDGVGVEQALSDLGITDNKMTKHVRDAVKLTEQLKEQNLEYRTQKTLVAQNLEALKKYTNIQQLSIDKARFMGDKESRSGYYGDYEKLMEEGQGTTFTDAFKNGIGSAQNEYKTQFQLMYEAGKELNNGLTQTFETGFFDMMSGKINSLADLFNNLGTTVKNVILGVISKMLAISATKMILGVDIQGGLTGGSSGGIGGGLLNSLVGGLFGSSKTTAVGGDIASGILSSVGSGGASSGIGSVLNMVSSGASAGGNMLTNVLSGAIGAKTVTSGGLLGGTKLGGMLDTAKNWIFNNPMTALGIGGAAAFLTQPGRLFGGTKDKTGAAQQALGDYNTQRQGYMDRRNEDALGYYMGSGSSSLQNYQFGGIGYSTWTSGDGWFKGPKEKHAAADPSAYIASLGKYYQMLMQAGESHYSNMKNINKTAETNQLKSIEMQYSFDIRKLTMIKAEYDRYSDASYTAADKYEKMDDYRNKLLDQEYANWQMQEEINKLKQETIYKSMEYDAFRMTSGEDSIAMMKVAIEIERDRLKAYTQGTTEWYDAKMSLMSSEKELALTLWKNTNDTKNNITSAAKQIWETGKYQQYGVLPVNAAKMVAGDYNSLLALQNPTDEEMMKYSSYQMVDSGKTTKELVSSQSIKNLPFNDDRIIMEYMELVRKNPSTKYDYVSNARQGEQYTYGGLAQWTDQTGKQWKPGTTSNDWLDISIYKEIPIMVKEFTKPLEQIRDEITTRLEKNLNDYSLKIKKEDLLTSIGKAINGTSTTQRDEYTALGSMEANLTNMNKLGLIVGDDYDTAKKEMEIRVLEFYSGLGDGIVSVIDSGYVSELDKSVVNFLASVDGGLKSASMTLYEQLMLVGRQGNMKSGILSTIKDMEDFSIYNQVMGSSEMSGLKSAMGSNLDFGGSSDPYQAYFDFNKQVIQTRISNAETSSDEWYAAQNDLFNLMIENAQNLKEKAEEVNRSMEDMLGKIEETMRMRIAEEKTTSKGDIMFIDVGSTRNSQAMLDKMLEAVQTNDPVARNLIEEFRKKMLGIGR